MKRVFKPAAICLATLALSVLVAGCKDENKPRITRINVSPACGVVPVEVVATAYASGGDETGSPLGGNNNLEMTWTFGDNATGSTSLAYHTYTQAGEYLVVATATDPTGASASASLPVVVLADSLVVAAATNFPGGTVTTSDIVQFSASAISCDVDYPTVPGDAVKLTFLWRMNDGTNQVFTGTSPSYRFPTAGVYDVDVAIGYPAWAVTRHVTIPLTVTAPGVN